MSDTTNKTDRINVEEITEEVAPTHAMIDAAMMLADKALELATINKMIAELDTKRLALSEEIARLAWDAKAPSA